MIDVSTISQKAITTQEVDLRIVLVRIGGTEGRSVICGTCDSGTKSQVSVRIDGKLGITILSKSEGKADIQHRRFTRITSRGYGCRSAQGNPFGCVSTRGECVISQVLRKPAYDYHHKHKHHA